jgi:HSP20 family protein
MSAVIENKKNSESCCATAPAASCETGRRQEWLRPRVDVVEGESAFTLTLDVPGVGRDSLEVVLNDKTLTIVGRRTRPNDEAVLHRESRVADYRREFTLGDSIDGEGVTATVRDGVAVVTLPKAEKVKPRKIKIAG